jgi:hypothetical protein
LKSSVLFAGAIVFAILIGLFVVGIRSIGAVPALQHVKSAPSGASGASPTCREHDGLPDSICTPGAASADVSQSSLESTICVSSYTARGIRSDGRPVRPPESFTEPFKVSGIAAYGYPDKSIGDYEEDHLIPLELGGDGWNLSNLWPEPRYGIHTAAEKDQVENELHRLVCAGTISLSAAQRATAANWETALTVVKSG